MPLDNCYLAIVGYHEWKENQRPNNDDLHPPIEFEKKVCLRSH